jgi:predicted PurR-regulated permease PerM
VKINALVSIVGIFMGGALAGISGMFLAMPVIAVLKILFDHSAGFRNWGVLLGDDRR